MTRATAIERLFSRSAGAIFTIGVYPTRDIDHI